MSDTDAILGAVIVIIGVTMIKDAAAGKPKAQPLLLGFMLGSALLALSFASPKLARGLALLGVVGALVVNGPGAFGALGKIGGGK